MIGEPLSIPYGTPTGFTFGTREVRFIRYPDRLYRLVTTGPDGYDHCRKVQRDGRWVAFENRDEMLAAAERVATCDGFLCDDCPFCGKAIATVSTYVTCGVCSARGPVTSSRMLAVSHWNMRGGETSVGTGAGVYRLDGGRYKLVREIQVNEGGES